MSTKMPPSNSKWRNQQAMVPTTYKWQRIQATTPLMSDDDTYECEIYKQRLLTTMTSTSNNFYYNEIYKRQQVKVRSAGTKKYALHYIKGRLIKKKKKLIHV